MKGRNLTSGDTLPGMRGSVLISAVIVLAFISVLGMSIVAFLVSRVSYSGMQLERVKAHYLAEAGISKSLWELKNDLDADGNGIGNVGKTRLGGGYYWARHDFQNSVICGTGEVNGIKRTFQIKYSAL